MLRSVVQYSSKVARSAAVCQTTAKSFATYKTTTGLAGLKVDPNGRANLLKASAEILGRVQTIPESSGYRKSVEQWFKYINKVCQENDDIKKIEDAIELGQIEEVLQMCDSEKELMEYYIEHKGWEVVEEAKANADHLIAEHADNIYFHNPENWRSYVKPSTDPAIGTPAPPAVGAGATTPPTPPPKA